MRRRIAINGESFLDGSPLRPVKYNFPHERRWSEHLQEEQPAPDPSMFAGKVTPELKELAQYFWDGYTGARLTKIPAMNGDGQGNLALEQWAIMFQNEMGLSFEEMEELWMYLISIRWATATAFRSWKVRLRRNELDPMRTPPVERKKAPPPLAKPARAMTQLRRRNAAGPKKSRWMIYIPGEGDWPIDYSGPSKEVAEEIYLEWAGRETLPRGAVIWDTFKEDTSPGLKKRLLPRTRG